MNFIRGMEPLRAMKIGIITWKNLSAGCILKSRRFVPLTECGGFLKFTSDRAKQTTHILPLSNLVIQKIERKKLSIIRIHREELGFPFPFIIEGSIERFQKYFDIVQER
jgi:hypothetical protein